MRFRIAGAIAFGLALGGLPASAPATAPGGNGPIVFQSYSSTANEIWIMDADGTNQDALTDNAVHDERPSISADGSRIAFMSQRAGDSSIEIYRMDADGSGQTQLTDNGDFDSEPAWSPDGSQIVYAGPTDLWVMNANGTNPTNVTDTPIAYECCPEYSPDGSKIAFTVNGHIDGDPSGPYAQNDIWVMNANGTGKTQLTFASAPDGNIQPTWSPDGEEIGYLHTTGTGQDVWTMEADGDNDAPITATAAGEYTPVWSPDGTKIAFEQPGGSDDDIVTSGVTLSPPGLFDNLTQNSIDDGYPSWAPAGGGGSQPNTKITSRPGQVIHTAKAKFKFKAVPPAGASFKCKLDSKPYRGCTSPKTYRNLDNGKHRFKVRASGPGGTDPSPATAGFKVKP
jgi:Tol biopolymer transport system component